MPTQEPQEPQDPILQCHKRYCDSVDRVAAQDAALSQKRLRGLARMAQAISPRCTPLVRALAQGQEVPNEPFSHAWFWWPDQFSLQLEVEYADPTKNLSVFLPYERYRTDECGALRDLLEPMEHKIAQHKRLEAERVGEWAKSPTMLFFWVSFVSYHWISLLKEASDTLHDQFVRVFICRLRMACWDLNRTDARKRTDALAPSLALALRYARPDLITRHLYVRLTRADVTSAGTRDVLREGLRSQIAEDAEAAAQSRAREAQAP